MDLSGSFPVLALRVLPPRFPSASKGPLSDPGLLVSCEHGQSRTGWEVQGWPRLARFARAMFLFLTQGSCVPVEEEKQEEPPNKNTKNHCCLSASTAALPAWHDKQVTHATRRRRRWRRTQNHHGRLRSIPQSQRTPPKHQLAQELQLAAAVVAVPAIYASRHRNKQQVFGRKAVAAFLARAREAEDASPTQPPPRLVPHADIDSESRSLQLATRVLVRNGKQRNDAPANCYMPRNGMLPATTAVIATSLASGKLSLL